jgi:hypothetical protein
MKTLLKIFFLMAVISLVAGCNKTDEIFDDAQLELKKAKMKVMPSTASDVLEKANEDWNNINNALQSAGSGDVVQLGEGLFYLHKSIIRWDFNGALKGSGKDKTTIQTAPEMLFDVSECPPLHFTDEEKDGFYMFCFAHHYNNETRTVSVSDLTIIVNEPTTTYFRNTHTTPLESNTLQAINVMYENLDNDMTNPINLNVMCKNIAIIGEKDVKYLNDGYSLYSGLVALGATKGKFEAKNMKIENAFYAIISNVFNGENSTVSLQNCKTLNNNNGLLSVLTHSWNITNCDFENSKAASLYLNKYKNIPNVELPSGNTSIVNNKINVSGGVAMATYDLENTKVINNVFYGSGFTGLYCERGNGWKIINNDFCSVNPISGSTLFLVNPMKFDVHNNSNQIVGGTLPFEPSIIIGEQRECNK